MDDNELDQLKEDYYARESFHEVTRGRSERARMVERYAAETKRNAEMSHLEKLLVCRRIKTLGDSLG